MLECEFCTQEAARACTDPQCRAQRMGERQSPAANYTGATSRPGGPGAVSGESGPVSGAVPDARLIPASRFGWASPVAAIQVGVQPGWRCTNGARLTDDEVAGTERLVPVGPLRDLLADLDRLGDDAVAYSEEVTVWVRSCADRLRATLATLLGESPTPPARKEGTDD